MSAGLEPPAPTYTTRFAINVATCFVINVRGRRGVHPGDRRMSACGRCVAFVVLVRDGWGWMDGSSVECAYKCVCVSTLSTRTYPAD